MSSWHDVAAAALGRQGPAVDQILSQISGSYDWGPYINEASVNLTATSPGWEDPARGAPAGVATYIVQLAVAQDPAAAAAGFASILPQLATMGDAENQQILAVQSTHGGSGLGGLGILGLVAGAAALAIGQPELLAAFTPAADTTIAAGLTDAGLGGAFTFDAAATDTASVLSNAVDAMNAANATTVATASTITADTSTADVIRGAVDAMNAANGTSTSITQALSDLATNPSSAAAKTLLSSLKDAVSPVTSALSAVEQFNKDVVQPIVQPISSTISTVTALVQVLDRDFKAGFKGLLQAPTDLANGLSSLDATWSRAFQQLDAGNRSNISDVLLPGLVGGHPGALGSMADVFTSALGKGRSDWVAPPAIHPTDGINMGEWQAWIDAQKAAAQDDTSLPGQVWATLSRMLGFIMFTVSQTRPYIELGLEQANAAAGISKFDSGTTQGLYQRGELSQADAIDELRSQGFSPSRAQLLLDATRTLPDTARILFLESRGWIESPAAVQMLKDAGWSEDDAGLLLSSSAVELGPDTLLELYRRGLQDEGATRQLLVQQGIRDRDAKLLLQTATRLLGVQDYMATEDRGGVVSGAAGFAFLSQSPPDSFVERVAALGIGLPGAVQLWINHWTMLPPQLAVLAYFRGYINRDQLGVSLSAAALPVELHQNYIDLQRPVIPTRSITTLMTHGVIAAPDAMRILEERGFDLVNANYLVQLAQGTKKPTQATVAADVHALSSSVILGLYDDHALAQDEAAGLLSELGWSPHAISSTLTFHDAKAAGAARAAKIALIIADAKARVTSIEDARAALAGIDMPAPQLDKALAQLDTDIANRTKLPSEAKILSMLKHGLLDDSSALDALAALGYSDGWAALLIALENAPKLTPAAAPSTPAGP